MNSTYSFPKAKLIPVNNIELEVFEDGLENMGKPIVLCHGWPEHAFTWRHQIPALVSAGYHVIVPNQRGYGNSSRPTDVAQYDLNYLTGDLVALLDHYGYKDAIFVGHDWGANVVWGLSMLHPQRVSKMINLSVPYLERSPQPWLEFLEMILGPDYYMVDFSKNPGKADAVLDENKRQFLNNLFRKNEPAPQPQPGNFMVNLANAPKAQGDPIMSEEDLNVFVEAFERSGFTPGINWYRNLNRNWHILGEVDPIVHQSTLMIYGDKDPVAKAENLQTFVPNVDIVSLDCGHWITEEMPEETNRIIIEWLK